MSGAQSLVTSDGVNATTIAQTSGSGIGISSFSLNKTGMVAYTEGSFGSEKAILYDGGTNTTLASTSSGSGGYSSFGDIAVNSSGATAFMAKLNSSATGIFTGSDSSASKVIETGDALFGSIVVDNLTFYKEGINDSGQIVFSALLENSTQQSKGFFDVIVLATPIPEPSSSILIAIGGAMLSSRRRS